MDEWGITNESRKTEKAKWWIKTYGPWFRLTPQSKGNLWDMSKRPIFTSSQSRCDICSKNNTFIVNYPEMDTFWPNLIPGFDPLLGKQGKFGRYAKPDHFYMFLISLVTLSPKIKFTLWLIGRWARFDPFWPLFCSFTPPRQGKFGWYMKPCHLHIFPTSHMTFAPTMMFILWFIGRWAHFDPFWPPFLTLSAPKTR